MKCTIVVTNEREEEIVIYTREKNSLTARIEAIAREETGAIIGYNEGNIAKLDPIEIYAVTIEDGKLFAITQKQRWQLHLRLYQAEELLGSNFIKINQSCLVNLKKIERFDTTLAASLLVVMKNGYKDYVSRRQLKAVKERIGFKL